MIRINLLPEELKGRAGIRNPEEGGAAEKTTPGAREKVIIYSLGVVLALFIAGHLYLSAAAFSKNRQLVLLNRKWLGLAPQKKELDAFNRKFSSASQGSAFLSELVRKRVLWAPKLNSLSLDLPSGVWFNDILVDEKGMVIQGSVVSLRKEELGLINKLLDSLKADRGFSSDFTVLELNNVQKRSFGGYDIADFTVTGSLKARG